MTISKLWEVITTPLRSREFPFKSNIFLPTSTRKPKPFWFHGNLSLLTKQHIFADKNRKAYLMRISMIKFSTNGESKFPTFQKMLRNTLRLMYHICFTTKPKLLLSPAKPENTFKSNVYLNMIAEWELSHLCCSAIGSIENLLHQCFLNSIWILMKLRLHWETQSSINQLFLSLKKTLHIESRQFPHRAKILT